MSLRSFKRPTAVMLALSFLGTAAFLLPWLAGGATAQNASDVFIIKTTSKDPDAVVSAIKSYSEQKKWQYLGDTKIKQGQITLVKICIPEVALALWPAGSHLSAMLPCGNIGVYKQGERTEISVLHPRYMHVLHPSPATERAAGIAPSAACGDAGLCSELTAAPFSWSCIETAFDA
jgi:hypothetical protein